MELLFLAMPPSETSKGGMAGYVANAMEQPLLLPKDMADLRSVRKYEVFLGLKRDLAMVSFFLFKFFFTLLLFFSIIYLFIFLIVLLLLSKPFKPLLGLRRW